MTEPQGYTQALVDILNSQLAQDIMNAYEQGAKDKEDGIIKLLEELDRHGSTHSERCARTHAFVDRAIALIKGEDK